MTLLDPAVRSSEMAPDRAVGPAVAVNAPTDKSERRSMVAGELLLDATAAPPTPSTAHPRLFMSAANLAAYKKNAAANGSAAAGLVAQCDDTVANASNYAARGGSDGNNWPQSAVACAFAYVVT